MSKELLLRIFLILLGSDLVCMAIGKPDWLFSFGARGLVIDFVIGIVVLVRYIKEDGTP